jgi:hypothetical protein
MLVEEFLEAHRAVRWTADNMGIPTMLGVPGGGANPSPKPSTEMDQIAL